MASLANWAFSSETYVTKATPLPCKTRTRNAGIAFLDQVDLNKMVKQTTLTSFDLTPLLEMRLDQLLGLFINFPESADVKSAVLAGEGAHPAHVVAIVRVFLPSKHVQGSVWERRLGRWQSM